VQSLVFAVPEGCNRDDLITALKQRGIESTLGTYAMSATTYYTQRYGVNNENARWLQTNTITLPCFSGVEVDVVSDSIHEILT
jgi:dTDP-4-amino-4,6-dideoxygalactose transaminase